MKWIIGVDEAGRGPLAGPVTVGAFLAPATMRPKLIRLLGGKIKDSKQLSHEQRTAINSSIWQLQKKKEINFSVTHVSAATIDKIGISKAVKKGIASCLKKLEKLHHTFRNDEDALRQIRLDGLLRAPSEYKNQKTIIKGDEKDVFIACASIVAKVSRDKLMCRASKKHPKYSFEIHKGYGTKLHKHSLEKYGLSNLHRISFCSNIFPWL